MGKFVFVLSGVYGAVDSRAAERKKGGMYADSLFALCSAGGNRGDAAVKRKNPHRRQRLTGSFTIEAACVMAIVLFSVSIVIRQAGRMHDETSGAMILHEAVEKVRHERTLQVEDAAGFFEGCMKFRMNFASYELGLKEDGKRIAGKAAGGSWQREIQMRKFRPETFLRQVTLLEDLDEH